MLLPLMVSCAGGGAEHGRASARASARFTLDLLESRVTSRDDLRAHLVITNTGGIPLWLNGRMLLGAGRSASPMNEVWVNTAGAGPLSWWCAFRTPPADAKHYVLLDPGESLRPKASGPSEDLRCLGMDAPGTYTLIAHYADGNDPEDVPPAPPGSVYLRWELVAAPVHVQIVRGSRAAAVP